jgi:hypothetical protein
LSAGMAATPWFNFFECDSHVAREGRIAARSARHDAPSRDGGGNSAVIADRRRSHPRVHEQRIGFIE